MTTLRLARTLNARSVPLPATFGRSLATATTSSHSSMIPVSNIEAQWATLSNKEQMEVYEQLLEVQKKDWKSMSLDEKKAAYYISFGPHGPRKPVDAPGAQWKIVALTTIIIGAGVGVFALIRSNAPPASKTMSKEWQRVQNEKAREELSNPLSGIASEGYTGKGYESLSNK
ncbi:Cytochrome c oxidase subunit 5A [Tulasnella sp. 330]|nr:Cytochrome c oxidase subunit 5A [Tulasnella sp. 330]KAG8882912.1 Cytochrome c oxidase subunit 5A [Tulasnella sp. 331]KAG8890995.1 Cytochrome c oxidase subunit 5A [Tulasnella sp. 332]